MEIPGDFTLFLTTNIKLLRHKVKTAILLGSDSSSNAVNAMSHSIAVSMHYSTVNSSQVHLHTTALDLETRQCKEPVRYAQQYFN